LRDASANDYPVTAEFYSARITDLWVWEAKTRSAYEAAIEALRDTPFWERYFQIVEILPAVESFPLAAIG
jgi:hypothetical protein